MVVKKEPSPGFFYGYWIICAAFLLTFIQSGCGFFAFSLFVKPLEAYMGWSRGTIMAAFTVCSLITGVASVFAGKLLDRYGARPVIAFGGVVMSVGFILLSMMSSLWHFYLLYGIIGVGMAAMGPVSASMVVSHWFQKRRGLAVGVMSSGIGAGGMVLVPLIGGYFIPTFGWRPSYLALGLLVAIIIIPLAIWVIKTRPADMGLYTDGIIPSGVEGASAAPLPHTQGLSLRAALSTSAFWLIGVSYLFTQFSEVGVVQSQVPFLDDIGFPLVTVTGALAVVSLMSTISKLGFGMLCDRISAKYAAAIGFALQFVGIIIILTVTASSSTAVIWFYAIVMGLGAGSWLPTLSMVISSNFGMAYYGAIFGLISLAERVGVAAGPLVNGYMYDIMLTYRWAFVLAASLYVISLPAILFIRHPKSLAVTKEKLCKT